jgi:hypothetical protein
MWFHQHKELFMTNETDLQHALALCRRRANGAEPPTSVELPTEFITEDPRTVIARIRGISFEPTSPQPIAACQPRRDNQDKVSISRAEFEGLERMLMQQGDQVRELAQRVVGFESLLQTFDKRLFRTEHDMVAFRQPTDTTPPDEIPDLSQVTKMQAQFFDNRKIKNKKSGKANFLLKINVWKCPEELIKRHPEGNCGNRYAVLYKPNTAYYRKRMQGILDYLHADDAQFIGCLSPSLYGHARNPNHAVIISPDWRLFLHLDGQTIPLGLPKPKPDDAKDNAAIHRWYWPDVFAN